MYTGIGYGGSVGIEVGTNVGYAVATVGVYTWEIGWDVLPVGQ
jgi:hypothetical protein